MKRSSYILFSLLLLTSCLLPGQTATPTPPPDLLKTGWDDRSIFEAGLAPAYQDELQELPGATVYHLSLNIEEDLYQINGVEEVRYTNMENVPLNEVRLRLFPNILGGQMKIKEVRVEGKKATPAYGLRNSLLTIPIPKTLEEKQSLVIKMDFSVTVPQAVEQNYGVLAYFDGVLALAHAYPMIAVYDDEGWNAEIPPQSGDVTYADMSFFIAKVTAPEKLTLVAAGREVQREAKDGRQIVTYAAGPVRDFYLAASPDYQVTKKHVGGIQLRFYTRHETESGAKAALDVAARAIEDYSQRYAPYPYSELDLVSTPTFALGIEYPGMIAISEQIVFPDHPYLEATVAHEVGHQWFYNLVGNDQLDDPWLDESLTQFATLQYFKDEYGTAGEQGFRQDLLRRWAYIDNDAIPIGGPVAAYTDAEYSGIIYGRGGLFFEALRDQIGTAVFDSFMKDYVASNSWGIATPERLKALAEKDCNCDLTPLFEKWVY